jgi:hypothetical protein
MFRKVKKLATRYPNLRPRLQVDEASQAKFHKTNLE